MPEYVSGDRVEAHQLTEDNTSELARLCGGRVVQEIDPTTEARYPAINVPTLGGTRRLGLGDYLVRHANYTWMVVEGSIFEQQYREV